MVYNKYNPTISSLIQLKKEEITNFDKIYYGVNYVDQACHGINITLGELIALQGLEKNRKTTFLLNILYNIAVQLQRRNYFAVYDTLESGMPPQAVRDQLVAISASLIAVSETYGKDRSKWPGVKEIHTSISEELLNIDREIVFEQSFVGRQLEFVEKATERLKDIPLLIFGSSSEQGSARDLKETLQRWDQLYKGVYDGLDGVKCRIFVCDNVQLVHGFNSNKFDQLETVVAEHAYFLGKHPGTVIIDVSQISQGAAITSKIYETQMYAKGGGALSAEATVLFETRYEQDDDGITISTPATRKKPFPKIYQEILKSSGAFLRPAYPIKDRNKGGSLF